MYNVDTELMLNFVCDVEFPDTGIYSCDYGKGCV